MIDRFLFNRFLTGAFANKETLGMGGVGQNLVGNQCVIQYEISLLEAIDRFEGEQQRMSTFLSEPITAELMRRKSESFQPELNEKGRAMQYVLGHFDGQPKTGELADAVFRNFSDSFVSRDDALIFVKYLVHKCT